MDAMLQNANEWAALHSHEIALATLFLGGAWALVNCLAGYTILRVLLVIYGVMVGVAVGVAGAVYLAEQRGQASASGMDILVACGAASALLALASWLLYRLMVALGVVAGGALLIAGLFGTPPPPVGWITGVLVGLVGGLAVFLCTRPLVIVLTALGGAVGAVYYGAALVFGGEAALQRILTGPDGRSEVAAVLVGVSFLLAIGGVFIQTRAARLFGQAAPAEARSRAQAAPAAG